MRRTCDRPGCAEPASVAFGMVPEDLRVWLAAVDPAAVGATRAGLLCTRHADAMVVPQGWTLDDEREPVPRLFRVPARPSAPSRPGDHTARLRRPRHEDWARLELFDQEPPVEESTESTVPEGDAPVDAAPDAAVVDAAASSADDTGPYMPQFDTSDDLDGLLTARSPLLRRAFRLDDDGPALPDGR